MSETAVASLDRVVARVIVLDPEYNALLLQRSYDDPQLPGELYLPGGTVESDESVLEVATRKLWLEARIHVPETALQPVQTSYQLDVLTGYCITRHLLRLDCNPRPEAVVNGVDHIKAYWLGLNAARVVLDGTPYTDQLSRIA